MTTVMDNFFKPKSVAIVGATASEKKVGYAVLRNILKSGYKGAIYPVNPKRKEIMGLEVYNSISQLPETPELAVLVVPPESCIAAIDELGKMGTKAFLVISAGFKETGEYGKQLEEKLVCTARKYDASIIGPNCLGIMDTHTPINATFATVTPPKGNVAVISQSGALLSAFFDWSIDEGVGFSKVISLGNQSDLDQSDFLEYLAEDPETDVVLLYVEGIKKGTKFIKAIKKASSQKPVLILKVGRSEAGARASSSHTGSVTGSHDAYKAAVKKGGALSVETMEDLFIAAKIFSRYRPQTVKNVAILTNAGGPGIIATDALESSSINLAKLSEETKQPLKKVLPPMASVNNPVDVIGDADALRYKNALEILLSSEETDSVIVLLTPQLMTEIAETARVIARHKNSKPIVAAFMGRHRVSEGIEILKSNGIPNYEFPEHTVKAFDFMNLYLERKEGYSLQADVTITERKLEAIKEKVEGYSLNNIKYLDEFPSLEIIELAEIPTPKRVLAKSEDEAVEAAQRIGFPVVMKVSSPKALHKSDIGGVVTGVNGIEEVKKYFNKLNNLVPETRGVLVEETAPDGIDLIVGFKKDPTFGAVVVVGLGGIYVEILKDIAHGIAPLSTKEATAMLKSLKSYPVLEGARGSIKVDVELLAEIISKFSVLAASIEELKEGEINPLRATADRIIALDARFIL
ncbi:hypothetical protein TST_1554 [Thermosulfidibacter takaii ABI70S6]|uniref:ATP-grasp domain-containing protein n=1 Tax=Thermosulfidibacter takaii (strain DSM 17441 / JCM 13301 / NBRC 103674 / ABI70S6) TaxID=1298851 RepID=A0A0S3QVI8_THET7|nr:acetate--CoA ligase [Thermosulfidibacter takaii]BAT72340.1 hypothetical protein TST_1554 [Thermosulfidibacter takaii ABI70S6]